MPLAGPYRPRHPEHTAFYRCLEDYWEEFKEAYPYFYERDLWALASGGGENRRAFPPMWDPSSRICPPALLRRESFRSRFA